MSHFFDLSMHSIIISKIVALADLPATEVGPLLLALLFPLYLDLRRRLRGLDVVLDG